MLWDEPDRPLFRGVPAVNKGAFSVGLDHVSPASTQLCSPSPVVSNQKLAIRADLKTAFLSCLLPERAGNPPRIEVPERVGMDIQTWERGKSLRSNDGALITDHGDGLLAQRREDRVERLTGSLRMWILAQRNTLARPTARRARRT